MAGAGLGRDCAAGLLRGGTSGSAAMGAGAALTALDRGFPHTPFASGSAAAQQRFADWHTYIPADCPAFTLALLGPQLCTCFSILS